MTRGDLLSYVAASFVTMSVAALTLYSYILLAHWISFLAVGKGPVLSNPSKKNGDPKAACPANFRRRPTCPARRAGITIRFGERETSERSPPRHDAAGCRVWFLEMTGIEKPGGAK